MILSHVTSSDLIFLDKNWGSREEILDKLSQQLFEQGRISQKEAFLEAVWQREAMSETGFERRGGDSTR